VLDSAVLVHVEPSNEDREPMTLSRASWLSVGSALCLASVLAIAGCASDDPAAGPVTGGDATDTIGGDSGGGDTTPGDTSEADTAGPGDSTTTPDTDEDTALPDTTDPDTTTDTGGEDPDVAPDAEDTGSDDTGNGGEDADVTGDADGDAGEDVALPCEEQNQCANNVPNEICCNQGLPNEQEYENNCYAECAGITGADFESGTCIAGTCDQCNCQAPPPALDCGEGSQYCDKTGQTYQTWCEFSCANQGIEEQLFAGYCGPCKGTCGCGKQDYPVCGADGKTYTNECFVSSKDCSDTSLACAGKCPSEYASVPACAACSATCAPVCGQEPGGNIISFVNDCYAQCNGATIIYPGACAECDKDIAPVCGSDFETYPNSCFAETAGATVLYDGECVCECDPNDYQPVCGIDGITYPNGCVAECAGLIDYTPGECP
jgi:hypothetical protein